MSVNHFETAIGRRSDDVRRYHNFQIAGGLQLRQVQMPVMGQDAGPLTEAEKSVVSKIATILRSSACRDSSANFLDLQPYAHTVTRAMAALSKLGGAQQRLLMRKLFAQRPDNMDVCIDVIGILVELAKSNSLKFDKSRTFSRVKCLKGFKYIKFLGRGAFGEVALVEKNGRQYAVKRVPVYSQGQVSEVEREIEIMKLIKGKGIGPDLHDYFMCKSSKTGNAVYLVMDYMNMGAISDHLELMDQKKYKNQLRSKLDQLHAMGIKHNDVVDNDGNAVFHKHPDGQIELFISDFGLAETTKMWLDDETLEDTPITNNYFIKRLLGVICAVEGLIRV